MQSGRAVALHDQEVELGGKQAFRLVEAAEDAGAEVGVRTVRVAFAARFTRGAPHSSTGVAVTVGSDIGMMLSVGVILARFPPLTPRLTRLTRPPEPS